VQREGRECGDDEHADDHECRGASPRPGALLDRHVSIGMGLSSHQITVKRVTDIELHVQMFP